MNKLPNIECEYIQKHLPEFSIGGGSARTRRIVQRHLDACPECAKELHALDHMTNLLDNLSLEPAPDRWDMIRLNLMPRTPQTGVNRARWWFGRHKLQSAAAMLAATIAIASLLLYQYQPTPNIDTQSYLMNHASMSWREPFADKAGLGLISMTRSESEDIQ